MRQLFTLYIHRISDQAGDFSLLFYENAIKRDNEAASEQMRQDPEKLNTFLFSLKSFDIHCRVQ